jgi:hypothetical protein
MTPNWIADTNRWNLTVPPEWFLQKLWNFDEQLVIVPSRNEPTKGEKPHYLLARRRQYSAGLGDVVALDNKHPDTNMCMVHGLIPIGPLRFKKGVNTFTEAGLVSLLDELASRDMWKITGRTKDPDAAWKALEAAEAEEQARERRTWRDDMYHRARDAYRSLKARTGQRNKRASDYHGVARSPRKEQRVVLTDAQ